MVDGLRSIIIIIVGRILSHNNINNICLSGRCGADFAARVSGMGWQIAPQSQSTFLDSTTTSAAIIAIYRTTVTPSFNTVFIIAIKAGREVDDGA